MIKRGWPAVLLLTLAALGLAALYLVVSPKSYESTTVLFVSANDPTSIADLEQGAQFSVNAVLTYAEIIDSATVLGPVAADLRLQRDVDDLVEMVTATVREETTLIEVTATGADPEQVTAIADAAAASATRVIPTLESTTDGRSLVRVQQIRRAVEPSSAVSPDVERVLAIGFIVGLSLGLGVTIATQALNTRIRRVEDIRAVSDVPLLAVLPYLTRAQRLLFPYLERAQRLVLPYLKRAQQEGLVVRDEPTGSAGEAFRRLRTNLRFLESRDRRSLVLTSVAGSDDGAKVPANLAWSLAQAGRRVLLVDLDLRRSTVGDAVGIEEGIGLADVLAGRVELPAVIRYTKHPRLRVVLSGTTQPSPSDLLSTPLMTGVLRRMEQDHDYVILHAPPLLSYTDAAVVSAVAGGTLVTVEAGRTRAQELTTALNTLANVRVRPLGLVLTGTQRPGGAVEEADPDQLHGTQEPRSVDSTLRHYPAQSG